MSTQFVKNISISNWIPYVSVAFFQSLKQNFIAYRSSKVSSRPDCIFEIHQLRQLGFSRLYSNCCRMCSFEPEIIKNDLSSYQMYSNNIVNFQESMTILNASTKKSGNIYIYIIIIIMSCCQHGYPWPSLATSPYRSSPLAGLQGYIPYPYIAAVCMFELVVLLLLGHMRGPLEYVRFV